MQFLVKAYDGQDAGEKRRQARPRHLAGMKELGERVICAGGLTDGEGNVKGSALVLGFASRAELDEYLRGEPYVTEGVWERIEVEPMNVVIVNGRKVGQ